ncbi:MAG: type II secretion system protein GspK [Magnetococcus sp. YQC-5]
MNDGVGRFVSGRSRGQEGMVLLVTLAAMAFLVPLVYAGVESQRFHLRQVQQELNLELARRNAESLLGLVVQVLVLDGLQNSATDHLNEMWAMPISLPDNEDGTAEAVVIDTTRYWNMSGLKKQDGQINTDLRMVLTHLLEREEIPNRLLENLIEWLKPVDGAVGQNTQASAVLVAQQAVEPIQAVEQLVQVQGWDKKSVQKIKPFFTVDEECKTGRLNVNTADIKTLELLTPDLNWQPVVERRQKVPFTQVAELATVGVTVTPAMANLLGVNSGCFMVRIRSQVNTVAGTLNVWMLRNGKQVTITKMRWNG